MSHPAIFLPQSVRQILSLLWEGGFEAYIVGGCVRDALMGKIPADYDITTSALPQKVKEIFSGCRVLETGLKHGTVTLLWEGEPFEITTFRIERSYTDHRHPDSVAFTSRLGEDLARRDFGINAMAYSPQSGLVDLYGGRQDLQKGIIACVGDADTRFQEDALRILRALRFAAVLGFSLEKETAAALRRNKHLLTFVSGERRAAELFKLLSGKNAHRILAEFPQVLCAAIPPLSEIQYPNLPSLLPQNKGMRLAGLLYGCREVEAALCGLKTDTVTKKTVLSLLKEINSLPESLDAEKDARLGLLTWGKDGYLLHLTFQEGLCRARGEDAHSLEKRRILANALLQKGICLSLKDLAIGGEDLKALGISGKAIGQTLQMLLRAVALGELPNSPEALQTAARTNRNEARDKDT